ncbi:MAG: hypothetical protein R3F19_34895 [Verrucomicrobiales bacterium]
MRENLLPQFKFQVALEAPKELRSVNEIAASNKVHPSQVTAWKKELREGGSRLFERKNGKNREFEGSGGAHSQAGAHTWKNRH